MSTFNGRRAPNVSHYLANLNTVTPPQDISHDLSIADADLDFLTNAEFFDFDSFNPNVDFNSHQADKAHPQPQPQQQIPVNGHQYQFGEFQTYPAPQANLHAQYAPQPPQQLSFPGPNTGDKRKQSSTADLEEQTRVAAEEDKRRRNTAASARFRVKKKQREQALEKQAKEMTEKVQQLEGKVQQLEMENKWLKGLITDKNDGKSLEALQKEREAEDRKQDEKTDGVGTVEDEVEEEEEEYDEDDE